MYSNNFKIVFAGSKQKSSTGNPLPSGFLNPPTTAPGTAAGGKSNQMQVIFNGKVATPQSLISRQHNNNKLSDPKKGSTRASMATNKSSIQTIDEASGQENLNSSGIATTTSSQTNATHVKSNLHKKYYSLYYH